MLAKNTFVLLKLEQYSDQGPCNCILYCGVSMEKFIACLSGKRQCFKNYHILAVTCIGNMTCFKMGKPCFKWVQEMSFITNSEQNFRVN